MQDRFEKVKSSYSSFPLNKAEIDYDQYLNQLLNMDNELKIKAFDDLKSFFSEVIFLNDKIEEVYQLEKDKISLLFETPINNASKKTRKNSLIKTNVVTNFDSDIIINFVFIMGYVMSLIYLLYPYYNPVLLCICLFCKLVTCIIVYITYRLKKSEKYKNRKKIFLYIDHMLIFISSFNLNVKILIIAILYSSDKKENSEELIRVIIYQFISTNMYLIVKLEASIKTTLFYFIKDFSCILLAQLYSKKEHYYLLDGITSFATYIIFYIFRKIWDLKLRSHFAAKLKFKDFFFYVNDLINGLKGYHFNVFDDNFISFNDKFNQFVKYNQNENKFYQKLLKDNIMKINEHHPNIIEKPNDANFNYKTNPNNEINSQGKNKDEIPDNEIEFEDIMNALKTDCKLYSIYNNKISNSYSNKMQINDSNENLFEELNLNHFLHNLILYNINSKVLSRSLDKSTIDSKSSDSDKMNEPYSDIDKEEDKKEREECLFDILINKMNKNKDIENFSVNILKTNNFNKLDNNENVECLGIFEVKKSTVFIEKILKFLSEYNNSKFQKSSTQKIQMKENENTNQDNIFINVNQNLSNTKLIKESNMEDSKDFLKFPNNNKDLINILEQTKSHVNKKYSSASIFLESKKYLKTNAKFKVDKGVSFFNKISDKKEDANKKDKFFEIFMRKVRFTNGRMIYNLIFYDVTELINAKNNLLKEDFHKTRLFAKIAHEFKTPLNSILSILYKMSEEFSVNAFQGDSFRPRSFANNMSNGRINNCSTERQNADSDSPGILNARKSYSLANVNSFVNKMQIGTGFKGNPIYQNLKENKFFPAGMKEQIFLAYDLINSINFLVSDIIILSNLNNLKQLNIRNDNLNFKEIISSTSKVLQTLIYLSRTKQRMIKTDVVIDSSIKFDLENQDFIKSDESKIKQILFNFITNAVKFTNKGSITIEAKITNTQLASDPIIMNDEKVYLVFDNKTKPVAHQNETSTNSSKHSNNKHFLCISVIDTGTGINPDYQKNIFNSNFEDDYKNNKNIKDIFKIRGFGLMICKYLAKIMKIGIGFSSHELKGSRFFIMFPIENFKEAIYSSKLTIEKKNSYLGINENQKDSLSKKLSLKQRKISSSQIKKDEVYQISYKNKSSKFNKKNYDNNKTYTKSENDDLKNWNIEINNKKLFSTVIKKFSLNNDVHDKSCISVNENPVFDVNSVNYQNGLNNDSNSSIGRNNGVTKRSGFTKKMKNHTIKITDSLTSMDNIVVTRRNSFLKIDDGMRIIPNDRSSFRSEESFSRKDQIIEILDGNSNNINIELTCKDYILIADDNHLINDVNKKIIETCLKKLNADYEIILCSDGVDIIRNILNEKMKKSIKCIITDENMEFLNGSEAIKFVRNLESRNYLDKIPIISVTSHEDKTIVNNILSCGANHVLSKPLTISSMINTFKLINF